MTKKIYTILILILGFLLIILYNMINNEGEENEVPVEPTWSLFIKKQEIKIPGEEEQQELEKLYEVAWEKFNQIKKQKQEIENLQVEILSANISSLANANFNRLSEKYKDYEQKLEEIKELENHYEEDCTEYLELKNKIPKYSKRVLKNYISFLESIESVREKFSKLEEEVAGYKEELDNIYSVSKLKADELFERDYYILCIIAYYEAGNCPEMEIAWVCNVIENRILSPKFAYAHNAYDVVWAVGQYEPTWTTSMSRTSPRVQKVVEDYLRGRIETGMPRDILFQAKFPQGPEKDNPWAITDSGHYFCKG